MEGFGEGSGLGDLRELDSSRVHACTAFALVGAEWSAQGAADENQSSHHACDHAHTLKHSHIHTLTHSDTHALPHSGTHTLIHSYPHTFMHSYIHALIHSSTHTTIHSYIHALIHSCTHTFMHSYIHAPIHSYTHALIHSCRPCGDKPEVVGAFPSALNPFPLLVPSCSVPLLFPCPPLSLVLNVTSLLRRRSSSHHP